MPFAYYSRLPPKARAVYDRRDRITALRLPDPERLRPLVVQLASSMAGAAARRGAGGRGHPHRAPVPALGRAARPLNPWRRAAGASGSGCAPCTTNAWWPWTFLRTILYEVGHHLDYTLLALPESFHTEGFYTRPHDAPRVQASREPSLFYQLVPRQE